LNFLKEKKHDFKKTNTPNAEGSTNTEASTKGPKCRFWKDFGHIQKDHDGFKNWLAKKGTHDVITFVDESLYGNVPLMHGVLILVPPCTLLIHHRDSLSSGGW